MTSSSRALQPWEWMGGSSILLSTAQLSLEGAR